MKKHSREKLYPEYVNPTLPNDLKNWLTDYSCSTEKSESYLFREWVKELQDEKIDLNKLQELSY